MKIASVQFASWDSHASADLGDHAIKVGDYVIVEGEFGEDAGRVSQIKNDDNLPSPSGQAGQVELGKIKRLATDDDWNIIENNHRQKESALEFCRTIVKRFNLEMKIIGCHLSFDDKRIVFAFIADGRVDFREVVKELTRKFQKNIRLHQLGVRDEAKLMGDIGCCGLKLCCKGCLKKLGSVTSEFAEQQQIAHRGSERLSGICGRLKCCLGYEKDLYEELSKKLPPVGTRVRTKHGRGEIIGWHTLRQSVDVRLDPEKVGDRSVIVEIPIKSEEQK